MPSNASNSGGRRRSPGSAQLRRRLVEQLEENGVLESDSVRRAFLALPRERFIPEIAEREGLERVYEDQAIVTAHDERGFPTSSSSQPSIMAAMLERLDLRRGQRVLEIGAGTGYNAALLARLVGARGQVISVELDPATARRARRGLAAVRSRARVVRGDGREGWPRGAPYDRIIVTASASTVTRAWHDQLAEGGLIELPMRTRQGQAILTLRKRDASLRSEALIHGGFMPLREAPEAQSPDPPPRLDATERVGKRAQNLGWLSGEALLGLLPVRRRRLLALLLSKPHSRALGLRAPWLALGLYVMIEAPADRLVSSSSGVGVMGRNGSSLAFFAGGRKTVTRTLRYGGGDAERLLRKLVEEWSERGRPGDQDLRVEVSFAGEGEPEIRWSWDTGDAGSTDQP